MAEKFCSFCGRPASQVNKLIAGPSAYICDECVELFHDLLVTDKRVKKRKKAPVAKTG